MQVVTSTSFSPKFPAFCPNKFLLALSRHWFLMSASFPQTLYDVLHHLPGWTCVCQNIVLTTESRLCPQISKAGAGACCCGGWVMLCFFAQLLREDFHGAQRMGAHGAAQPGWHLDCQLLQWPDGARVGGSDKGMQSWAPRARACGRVHFLGSWELLLHHIRSYRIRGNVPGLLHKHAQGELCLCSV